MYKKKPKDKIEGEKPPKEHRKRGRKARRCGECIACYRVEDCGRCDFCKVRPPTVVPDERSLSLANDMFFIRI